MSAGRGKKKTAKVRDFYDANIHDIGEYLPFEQVMKPEYANASKSMKSIKEEILELIQKVDEGLAILSEVESPYAGDMKEVFLKTYDIGAAMAERNRLETQEQKQKLYAEEQARKNAEREAKLKAEAERVMAAGARTAAPAGEDPHPDPEQQEEPVYEMCFRVYGSKPQILSLRDFMKAQGIRFEKI